MLNLSFHRVHRTGLTLLCVAVTAVGSSWAQSMPEMPVLKAPAAKPIPAINESATTKPVAAKNAKSTTPTLANPQNPRQKVATLPPPSKITLDFYNAVVAGNLELAEILFAQGPDVNCLNCGDFPALHNAVHSYWSASNKSTDPVLWLAKHGANLSLQDPREGTTVLHQVLLLALRSSVWLNAPEEVVALLQKYMANGASPKVADFSGLTPLHLAARYIQLTNAENGARITYVRNLFNALGNAGADVNAISSSGYTPLMYGLSNKVNSEVNCNKPLVEHLMGMGADVRRTATDGATAYTVAYDYSVQGYKVCNPLLPLLSTSSGSKVGSTKAPLPTANSLQKANVGMPADLVGEWKGVLRIKSPSAMAVAVTGTMSADGTVQLNAPMGVTTVGVVTRADDAALNFRLHTIAPEGAHFKNGSRVTEDFDVSGTVANRIYRGNYVAPTDSGEFILCQQEVASRQTECSPTFGESISNLVGGLMGVLGGAQ